VSALSTAWQNCGFPEARIARELAMQLGARTEGTEYRLQTRGAC